MGAEPFWKPSSNHGRFENLAPYSIYQNSLLQFQLDAMFFFTFCPTFLCTAASWTSIAAFSHSRGGCISVQGAVKPAVSMVCIGLPAPPALGLHTTSSMLGDLQTVQRQDPCDAELTGWQVLEKYCCLGSVLSKNNKDHYSLGSLIFSMMGQTFSNH